MTILLTILPILSKLSLKTWLIITASVLASVALLYVHHLQNISKEYSIISSQYSSTVAHDRQIFEATTRANNSLKELRKLSPTVVPQSSDDATKILNDALQGSEK